MKISGGTTEIELWIILIQTSSLFLVKTNLTFKDSSVLTITTSCEKLGFLKVTCGLMAEWIPRT